jgi:hypothetical protein
MAIGFIIAQPELIIVLMAIGRCQIVEKNINLGNGETIIEDIIGLQGDGDSRKLFPTTNYTFKHIKT